MLGIAEYRALWQNWRPGANLPAYTEARIKRLCERALGCENEDELRHILKELRAALREHLRLATETLGAPASVIPVLENRGRGRRTRKKPEPST